MNRVLSNTSGDGIESVEPEPIPITDKMTDTFVNSHEEVTNDKNETENNVNAETNSLEDYSIVPRNERRGLFAFLCLTPEQVEPHNYPKHARALMVFIIAFAAMCGPMAGSIILPGMNSILDDLEGGDHSHKGLVNISYGLYILSLGIFPLWWSSSSEIFGRRTIYIISFTVFVGFLIACALSTSMGMLMAFRVLSGAGAAAVQSVGAGTIGDMYIPTKRGAAVGYFYLGPLIGPLVGPLAGGAIVERWGWKGTQWFMVIIASVILVLILFLLPETLREEEIPSFQKVPTKTNEQEKVEAPLDRVLTGTEENVPDSPATALQEFNIASRSRKAFLLLVRPLKSVKFLTYPPVLLVISYNAFCYFCLYFLNVSLESLYTGAPYNFSPVIVGLMYMPNTLGYIVSSVLSGRYSDMIVRRVKAANNGVFIPEARFAANVFMGAVMYPLALILFGWTAQYHVFWFIPLIGSFLYGMASMIIFGTCMTYLVDALPGRGSSGVAVNNLVRMILAAVSTFVSQPMQESKLGYNWLYMLWGLLGLCMIVLLFAIRKWGNKWRTEANFNNLYS